MPGGPLSKGTQQLEISSSAGLQSSQSKLVRRQTHAAQKSLISLQLSPIDSSGATQRIEVPAGGNENESGSGSSRAEPASIAARPVVEHVPLDVLKIPGSPENAQTGLEEAQNDKSHLLLSFQTRNATNSANSTSTAASKILPPVITRDLLICVISTGVLTLVFLVATIAWVRSGPRIEDVPRDSFEEPAIGRTVSLAQIWGITTVNFAYGISACIMGIFLIPKEAGTMFPENGSIALGAFELMVSCSMLIGPLAGRISDSFRHPVGRRKPIVHISIHFASLFTVAMWAASLYNQRALYVLFLLFQQMSWNGVNASQTALLADIVDPARKDVASAIQVASLLAGAVVSIVIFEGFALSNMDFRYNYLAQVLISWAMLPLMHLASPEQSSELLALPAPLDASRPREAWSSVFYLGDDRSPDFALITRERGVYYAGVATKAFIFFFIKDGLGIKGEENQELFLGEVAFTSSCAATMAGLIASLIFSVTRVRPQVVACFGAFLMAFASQFWGATFMDTVAERKFVMLCYIVGYGGGQGFYLAADLALAIGTMPDPNEASRYMGLWGLSAFIGGGSGSIGSALLMQIFGRWLPQHMGIKLEDGAYHMYGYMALLISTFFCDAYVGTTCLFVRTRDEYANPQGDQAVEILDVNPQDI